MDVAVDSSGFSIKTVLAYNIKRVLYSEKAKELGIPLWVNFQTGIRGETPKTPLFVYMLFNRSSVPPPRVRCRGHLDL